MPNRGKKPNHNIIEVRHSPISLSLSLSLSCVRYSSGSGAGSMKGKNVSVPKGAVIECNDSSSDSEGGSPRPNKVNGSLKSGGKAPIDPTFSKGKSGGKSSEPFIPSTPKINAKEELPKDAVRLMDCEAADILQGIQDQLVVLSEDSTIKLPRSFDDGLRYAKLGSHYTSSLAVKRVLETLKSHKVSDEEICTIANTCP
ncbi:hypothetical protein Sjap_009413 [Stephania japonica]|uniref:Uncharacterized protein n=1 Tax=Stephania japonica TaxID=461633 RepID=A0AAP0PDA3_9MAGN